MYRESRKVQSAAIAIQAPSGSESCVENLIQLISEGNIPGLQGQLSRGISNAEIGYDGLYCIKLAK